MNEKKVYELVRNYVRNMTNESVIVYMMVNVLTHLTIAQLAQDCPDSHWRRVRLLSTVGVVGDALSIPAVAPQRHHKAIQL